MFVWMGSEDICLYIIYMCSEDNICLFKWVQKIIFVYIDGLRRWNYVFIDVFKAVLRIHLIWCWSRIRILDPQSSDLGFRGKKGCLQFLVDILPLGSGSVDPHIFADPDPGSQNLADPTDPDPDPDPKHWFKDNICLSMWVQKIIFVCLDGFRR